jgi:uncharacterized protein
MSAMSERNAIARRRALALLSAGTFVSTALRRGRAAADKDDTMPKILFFSKSSGYEHGVVKRIGEGLSLSEAILTEVGRMNGFDVIATKDGRVFDGDLAQYNAFFFFTTGNLTEVGTDGSPAMSVRGKEALLTAIRDGKGFLGVHSASDTFHSQGGRFQTQNQLDPYIAMLGGEFLSHGSQQEARVKVADAKFPGLQGLSENFTAVEEWYSLKNCTISTIGVRRSRSLGRAKKAGAASISTPWAIAKTFGGTSASAGCSPERSLGPPAGRKHS